MVRRFLTGLALAASVVAVPSASAQAPAAPADSGIKQNNALIRVSLYRFADGMQPAAVADMRTHLIPIWEAEKQAGILVGYSTMANVTANSAEDWQFGIVLTYKNFAALDSLGARTNAITLKHYGSAAARTATNEARGKLRKLVSTNLANVSTYSRQ
jgi:hypothetical protein